MFKPGPCSHALASLAFLLVDSARVLVTHQRQYLPQCDRVLVLRAGRVHAIGTPAELAPLKLPELQATEGDSRRRVKPPKKQLSPFSHIAPEQTGPAFNAHVLIFYTAGSALSQPRGYRIFAAILDLIRLTAETERQ